MMATDSSGGSSPGAGGQSALGGDSGDPSGGAASGGGAMGGSLPGVFVAQGHLGRLTRSLDDGASWTSEQSLVSDYMGSEPEELECFTDLDCDHHAHPARGLVFGGGYVFATFGWGDPGGIFRSGDGASWEPVLEGTTFGGLAYVQGVVIAGARMARRSTDHGATWSEAADSGLAGWNVRRVGQTASHGGRVILVGEAGDAVISDDAGETYRQPEEFPAGCGASIQTVGGIAAFGDIWLVVGGDGSVCRSTDGGEHWTADSIGSEVSSHLTHTGMHFLVLGVGTAHLSADGVEWTSQATVPANLNLGPLASDGAGHLVAVRGGWQTWYDGQVFYRSTNGYDWEPAETFVGSHPIRSMEFGRLDLP